MSDDDADISPLPNARFEALFALVLTLGERKPSASVPRRLNALFKDLQASAPSRAPDETLDLVWAFWISHPCEDAAGLMVRAIDAIADEDFDAARPILDTLVVQEPDWAEAWNKRATLAFIQERDGDALADIEKTLMIEPRHFGAVSGFGQICLRHGLYTEAKAAFQVALGINPHLQGLREAVCEIDACRGPILH